MEGRDQPPLTHAENEAFLRWLRDQKAKLGVYDPEVEVRFEGLHVEADVLVGRRASPTLVNTVANAMQEMMRFLHLCPTRRRPMEILKGVKGIIRPSRMTLLLGSPGSGKSTLLRALSGKLDPTLKFKGRVTYNGQELNPSIAQCLCAYVSQHDLHHAEMTVRETLDFSRGLFGSNHSSEILEEAARKQDDAFNKLDLEFEALAEAVKCGGRQFFTDYVIKLLGLSECAEITIGDEMRRGISGGEKKRVTIGEMLVGLAQSFFMDDISTGLDSSTTFQIVMFLRQMAHLMNLTMVISLLQPPPEIFELFDDIILLSEGHIVYQGPRQKVLEFFEHMHFRCPKRKNIADFLQEVTSQMDQKQYWDGNQGEYHYVSVEMFAEAFHGFDLGRLLEHELCKPYDSTKCSSLIEVTERYNISMWEVFKACFSREVLLWKRNSPVHIFKTVQIALLAFVIMTLFFRTEMEHSSIADGNKFIGAVFAGVVIVKFNGMTELSMIIKRLPVFYKQRELLCLPGWALLTSIFILSLPMSLVETGVWTSLTYFVIGFAPSAIRFFQQFLALFCVHQMSMGLFRCIAVVGRTQVMANTLAIATLIAVYILGGFVISKDDIQPWLIWGYWTSPLTYGQNAVAINEFLDKRWSMEIDYKDIDAHTVGEAVLRSRGLLTEWKWFWICVGALLGFSLVSNTFSIFALEYLNSPHKHQNNKGKANASKKIETGEKESARETLKGSGMVLSFKPLTLVFHHINYYVDMPSEMKKHGINKKRLQLLRDVSGAFRPGVLTALMGVTGAGKTTLLDVLAGRKTGGYIEGRIGISGYSKRQETFARISGYCEQTDIHSPFLTVYESLKYSAWLRLPSNIETRTRHMLVEEIMDLVELKPLKNAMVGLPGFHGLSAEQRKRLTIAVELVSSPSIIFMDEPTTGLDARAAAIVMRTVRKTVDTGRTVVCTIHQPSIEIFEAFDELLLMKRGGQLIYGGPLGPLSMIMVNYFESIPGVPKIRADQNPAAWMLDISSSVMEREIGIDYAEIFHNSSLYRDNIKLVHELSTPKPDSEDLHFPSRYCQSFTSQCRACLWKQHRSYWKNPEHNVVRFVATIVTSLLFGTVFWQIGSTITREQDIFNILGVMYGSALFLGFTNANLLQPIVWMERTVFYRESAAGMYSSMPYTIAQILVEMPYIIIQVLIFSAIAYPMIGFQFVLSKFAWFVLFMLLSFIYFTLLGMMAVALTPTQEIAALLSFLIFILWNVFSGFIIPRKVIPVWWRWYYWANPAAWTVYGLMFSQLGDRVELIRIPGSSDQSVKEFLEDYLGLQDDYFTLIVALHIGIILLFLFVYGFSIQKLNFQKR